MLIVCPCLQPPSCRLKLEKCNKGDVPVAPKEERPEGTDTNKVVVKSADPHAEETVIELDDWLIEFANLFREQLGIDPDKCGLHRLSLESCASAGQCLCISVAVLENNWSLAASGPCGHISLCVQLHSAISAFDLALFLPAWCRSCSCKQLCALAAGLWHCCDGVLRHGKRQATGSLPLCSNCSWRPL